jgi:hypothetical protein
MLMESHDRYFGASILIITKFLWEDSDSPPLGPGSFIEVEVSLASDFMAHDDLGVFIAAKINSIQQRLK